MSERTERRGGLQPTGGTAEEYPAPVEDFRVTDTNLNEALAEVRKVLGFLVFDYAHGADPFELEPTSWPSEADRDRALASLSQIEARLGELEKEQRALRDWYDESPMKEWPDD